MSPVIQNPIDSGGSKTCLSCDLFDGKTMRHLMSF